MPARSTLDDRSLDQLFREARSYPAWLPDPVGDDLLHALWNLTRWGPTTMNSNPVRIVFVRSADAKARLIASLTPGNVEKVRAAPVTAIIAYDLHFHEQLTKLVPHNPNARDTYAARTDKETTALRNSSLQGGYFILAARALGLDCGPMSGFDNAKVDATFFGGSTLRSNFLCSVGYGDPAKVRPRAPRLSFDEACRIE
jgi:3-hydroxypropanoate dehydrogenase